ncbi:MAG: adenosine deaminase, partial [Anaerolineaceae bacterium 4572_32.1]
MTESSWFEQIPKVELHLHLEGAIPLDALWELVGKYGGDPAVPDLAALERKFEYRDFPRFIETWIWKNGFLREYEDFTFIAEAVACDLAAQNVRYAEVFFSPTDFAR